jgi:hypothetical protein
VGPCCAARADRHGGGADRELRLELANDENVAGCCPAYEALADVHVGCAASAAATNHECLCARLACGGQDLDDGVADCPHQRGFDAAALEQLASMIQ